MKPMSKHEFNSAAATDKYFRGRWHYFEEAIKVAARLRPKSVLEIGAYTLPLFYGSDRLDIRRRKAVTVVHDIRKTPWPMSAAAYDLLIALQVWEHLNGRQEAAFLEACRLAKHVLLSVPYKWNVPANPSHHAIDEVKTARWTCFAQPEWTKIVSDGGPRRYMLLFDSRRFQQQLRARYCAAT
jgi:hypothetical protein